LVDETFTDGLSLNDWLALLLKEMRLKGLEPPLELLDVFHFLFNNHINDCLMISATRVDTLTSERHYHSLDFGP
jgi:hypothetical protein